VSAASNLVEDDLNGQQDDFLFDAKTGSTIRVSLGVAGELPQGAGNVRVAAKGHHVVFATYDETVVSDDTNEASDVFVRDLKKGITTRVSVDSEGGEAGT